jgi:serine protease Do
MPVQQQILTKQDANLHWEKDNRNETDFKNYYQNNLSTLDDIEGIWSVNGTSVVDGSYRQDEPNYATVAIIRDTTNSNRDYYEVVLSGDNWLPHTITAHFQKGSYENLYISKQFSYDGSYSMYNFTIDKNGVLRASKNEILQGRQFYTEIYYVKIFPKFSDKNFESNKKSTSQKTSGSGIIVSEGGFVITNYHVIEDANKIEIVIPEKNTIKTATVKIKDSKNDIAILEISNFSYSSYFSQPIPFVLADINTIKVGEEVFTLGFPLGDIMGANSRLSNGRINSLYGLQDDPRLFQISNPLQPGNSGGPLFNSKGELVGLVVSSLNAKYFYENVGVIPQNVNFAVKSTYIQNLISMIPEGDEILKRKNLVIQGKMEEQIEQLNPFVVQIKVY